MDLALDDDRLLLASTLRDACARECTGERVRAGLERADGCDPDVWRRVVVDVGLTALLTPDGGGDLLDAAVAAEELARAVAPVPFLASCVLGTRLLVQAGAPLPQGVVEGEAVLAAAVSEVAEGRPSPVSARRAADGWVVDGTSRCVVGGIAATHLVVPAATGDGLALLLVDAAAAGVHRTPLPSIGGNGQAEVRFDGAPAVAVAAPGPGHEAEAVLAAALDEARTAQAAAAAGGAAAAVALAVEYAAGRVQFDRPIGAFQAVQHHLADAALLAEGARLLAREAAWLAASGRPFASAARLAAGNATAAYRRVSAVGIQVLGGYGYMEEADMHLHFRAARGLASLWGAPTLLADAGAEVLAAGTRDLVTAS